MSRALSDLAPDVRAKCERLLRAAESAGLALLVTQTYRTPEEQAAIYAQGRTAPGKIVTNAPPGYSWHEFRRAFDVCFLRKGRAVWSEAQPGDWERVGALGEECGLEWGGRWKRPDRPHFEDRGGLVLAELRKQRAAGVELA